MMDAPTADDIMAQEQSRDDAAGRVEKWLLQFLAQCLSSGEQQSRQVRDIVDQSELLYRGSRIGITKALASVDDLDRKIEVPDVADQADALAGLMLEQVFPSSGPSFTVSSDNARQASCVQLAMLHCLSQSHSQDQVEASIYGYCKYQLAGLKFERSDARVAMTEEREVDQAQLQSWIAAHTEQGHEILPVKSSENGEGLLVATARWEKVEPFFGLRNIDVRKHRYSDARRLMEGQHGIYEAFYWTRTEMQAMGFDVSQLGTPNAQGRHVPVPNTTDQINTTVAQETNPFEAHEIWMSDVMVPWRATMEGERPPFDQLDLDAWASDRGLVIENGITADDYAPGRYWRFFHKLDSGKTDRGQAGAVLFKCVPNPLRGQPKQIPAWATSFIAGDGELAGQSQMQRQSELNAGANMVLNNWLDNQRRVGRPSGFISGNMPGGKAKFSEVQVPGNFVVVPGALDPRSNVFPWPVTDITSSAMAALQYLQSEVKDKGVNPALQGQSSADTATEAQINNARGQVKITSSFKRYVRRVWRPALQAYCVEIVLTWKPEDYVQVCGEEGMSMAGINCRTADEVLSHFRVDPVATFDYAEKKQVNQALMGTLNIAAAMLPPAQVQEMVKAILETSGAPQSVIERIEGTRGTMTDFLQELESMLADPSLEVTVRPEENHEAALAMWGQFQMMRGGDALVLSVQKNFQNWLMQRQAGLQMQRDQQAMAMESAGGGKRGHQPPPKGDDSSSGHEEKAARKEAQLASPTDGGDMTSAGLTGRAAVPA